MEHDLRPTSRCPAEQLDLFAPPRRARPSVGLSWQQLPADTRQTLTRLMARLLLEHEGDGRTLDSAGERRDV